ncbi:hypothetical protein [Paenibacillus silviterrae]|nr:hypothetical protein [Paenibacillus chinjuensis]
MPRIVFDAVVVEQTLDATDEAWVGFELDSPSRQYDLSNSAEGGCH